jgi:hypothetical protein
MRRTDPGLMFPGTGDADIGIAQIASQPDLVVTTHAAFEVIRHANLASGGGSGAWHKTRVCAMAPNHEKTEKKFNHETDEIHERDRYYYKTICAYII